MKRFAMLIAICLIPVPLWPQEHSPAARALADSRVSIEVILGEKLVHEYERQTGLGNTP